MIKKFLSSLNHLIKKKNIILFSSYPAYSDNVYSLYKYIIKNRKDIVAKYKLIWAQDPDDIIPAFLKEDKNFCFVSKKSYHGIITFLQAKYVISSHGYFNNVFSGNGQYQINLWHGCGYKKIPLSEHVYTGDCTIATSDLYCDIQSKELGFPRNKVFALGYPRNDSLFEKNDFLSAFGFCKDKYKKVYIWMPTYRKGSTGHTSLDGSVSSFGIGTISDSKLVQLNQLLKQKDELMLIKPHPMDTVSIERLNSYSNIRCITNNDLANHNIQLNELLGNCDCLLSDYSSVIIDFLILNRPIAIVCSDRNEYKNTRGFVFDPVENYFPGPILEDFSMLYDYLKNADLVDLQWRRKRNDLRNLFHKYKDNMSSQRVCEKFFGKYNDYE